MNCERFLGRSLLILGACLIGACGGGGEDKEDLAQIDDILFDEESVAVTDQVTLKVDISYSVESVFNADQDVIVLLRVSGGLDYVTDSARVDRDAYTGSIRTAKEECSNGDTYLRLFLTRSDLSVYSGEQDSTSRILLTLRGVVAGPAFVEGRAQYNEVVGSCSAGIRPDAAAPIVVTATRAE